MIRHIEAESSVLGALLVDTSQWHRIAGILTPDDFSEFEDREIAKACAAHADQPASFIQVDVWMRERGAGNQVAKLGTLANDFGYARANLEGNATVVAEFAKRRRIESLCRESAELAKTEYADELLTRLNIGLEQITRRRTGKVRTLAEVIDLGDKAITEAGIKRKAGVDAGVPTGIACLDSRTGGWAPETFIIIAARPSLGKTALLNQIGVHAARRGHAGMILSLEMGAEMLGIRAMATAAEVNVTKLMRGFHEEHEKAALAGVELAKLPLYVDTDTYTLGGICAQISEYRRTHGIKWAAIDHIGLVEAEGFNSRNDQLGAITRTLKKLGKRLGIPIIGISQLTRGVEKERRRPLLSDLRDSGNLEQDADVCLFLHSDAEDNKAAIKIELGLLKNRGGRKGWIEKTVMFNGATQTFTEVAVEYEECPPEISKTVRKPRREPAPHHSEPETEQA